MKQYASRTAAKHGNAPRETRNGLVKTFSFADVGIAGDLLLKLERHGRPREAKPISLARTSMKRKP